MRTNRQVASEKGNTHSSTPEHTPPPPPPPPMDGKGLLKTYALSMEDKMAAGAFRRARNYGSDGPFNPGGGGRGAGFGPDTGGGYLVFPSSI